MFDAQLLLTKSSSYSVFSPWFPRGGDNLRVTLERVAAAASADEIGLAVVTKNVEDSGDGTVVAGSITVASGSTTDAVQANGEWNGLVKELVRYKFTVKGASNAAGNWLLFRVLSPVWYNSVDA